jgi:hypothetical protein
VNPILQPIPGGFAPTVLMDIIGNPLYGYMYQTWAAICLKQSLARLLLRGYTTAPEVRNMIQVRISEDPTGNFGAIYNGAPDLPPF